MATINYARINHNAATAVTVVSSVSGQEIFIVSYAFTAGGANQVTFRDENDTVRAGPFVFGGAGVVQLAGTKESPLWKHAVNQSCEMALTAATTISGHLAYYTIG